MKIEKDGDTEKRCQKLTVQQNSTVVDDDKYVAATTVFLPRQR